ncbi:MAG: GTP pyrophosphokinase [Firmicutes bacterium]|nr:GTP pyrophosphokinase [Bacillota bacterium]
MTNTIPMVKEIISEVNRIHAEYSKDYFETGKVQKINLSRTIANVPLAHIYNYRLNLHESINDYLIKANISIRYFYRVKTRESIDYKIQRFQANTDQYPVNNWMNDIFGARIILDTKSIEEIIALLDGWQDEYGLKNWYMRVKDGYKGLHIYFKNKSNFYFPWELQIWDEKDIDSNISSHERHKRNFV